MRVKQVDPAWPVMAVVEPKPKPSPQQPAAIHINPKFIKKVCIIIVMFTVLWVISMQIESFCAVSVGCKF